MEIFSNILRGMAIGIANIIPGVSGGTMALMLGIFERLLSAISNINWQFLKNAVFSPRNFFKSCREADMGFLISLGAGAGISIIAIARIMEYLLTAYHDPTYGFFFGLVLASAVFPFRLIQKISGSAIAGFVVAVIIVVALSIMMTGPERLEIEQKKAKIKAETMVTAGAKSKQVSEELKNLFYFAFSGSIAISAMILPGISGSFMMLLLGIYFDLLVCINQKQLLPLAFFASGCLIGLAAFSRLLKFMLKNFHDQTMSFLLGLVFGSLYAIWPFKEFGFAGNKRIDLGNIFPASIGTNEQLTIVATLSGLAIVVIFILVDKKLTKT